MIKRIHFLAGCLVFLLTASYNGHAATRDTALKTNVLTVVTTKNGPLGVWDYEVSGTEDAYKKGVLFVRLENGQHKVEVHLGNGVLNGQDVEVNGNTLKFMVNIDGVERVAVVLNANEDSLVGEASSSQGTFKIKGSRKLPPQ